MTLRFYLILGGVPALITLTLYWCGTHVLTPLVVHAAWVVLIGVWGIGCARYMHRMLAQAQQLRESGHIKNLEAANEDLQKFASVAAHQLRSPPRTISGVAQALMEDYGDRLDEEGRQFLHDILTDANNMAEVVDGLYRLSKVRSVESVATEDVDLNLVMQDIQAVRAKTMVTPSGAYLFRREKLRSNRELRAVVIEPLPGAPPPPARTDKRLTWDKLPIVRGDRVLLTEAFTNLIDNGFKFNRSQPKRVHITVETPPQCPDVEHCTFENPHCWCIRVTDNGVGIPMEYRHKLFVMFERLHPEFPGTGVGLALVQTIVRKIGGEIMVQPNPKGSGTVFCLGLPRPRP